LSFNKKLPGGNVLAIFIVGCVVGVLLLALSVVVAISLKRDRGWHPEDGVSIFAYEVTLTSKKINVVLLPVTSVIFLVMSILFALNDFKSL